MSGADSEDRAAVRREGVEDPPAAPVPPLPLAPPALPPPLVPPAAPDPAILEMEWIEVSPRPPAPPASDAPAAPEAAWYEEPPAPEGLSTTVMEVDWREEPAPPPLPDSIGPYEVLGEIGSGASGVTYRARHKLLRRPVAIKLLRGASGNQTRQARFLREAQALASLNHPNVLSIHDCGEHERRLWMALEMVEGGSLADLLAAQKEPLPLEPALRIARGILSGLAAAHGQGILHRDIKPANLLLAADQTVKVADFGLAKLELADSITTEGITLGTPIYMAPEQFSILDNAPKFDARSDLYAVGAVLFELLTGSTPYGPRDSLNSVTELVMRKYEAPQDPCRLRPDLPPEVGAFIRRLLEPQPERRLPSAKEALEALDAIRLPLPVLGPLPPPPQPIPPAVTAPEATPEPPASTPEPPTTTLEAPTAIPEPPAPIATPEPRATEAPATPLAAPEPSPRRGAPTPSRSRPRPTRRLLAPGSGPVRIGPRPAAAPPSPPPAKAPPAQAPAKPPAPRSPVVVVLRGESWTRELQLLPGQPRSLGRNKRQAELVVADNRVSGLHCTLRLTERGEVWLKDCESANGTYLNRVRIGAPVRLYDGDAIQLGNTVLALESPALGRRPRLQLRCSRCGGEVRPGSIAEGSAAVVAGAPVCPACNGASLEELLAREGLTVEARIGTDGVAPLYRARQGEDGKRVVVAVLDLSAAPAALKQAFERDAALLSKLTHPALPKVLEARSTPRLALAVTEPVLGETLEEVVERRGPLEVRAALELVHSVVEACALAEKAGLLHRNLSPAVVLITPAGETKLTRFQLGGGARPAPKGAPGEAWAVGALLHFALTGEPARVEAGWTPVLKAGDSIPVGEVEAFLRLLLAPDPDARPASLAALLTQLERTVKETLLPGFRGSAKALFDYVKALSAHGDSGATGCFGRVQRPKESIGGRFQRGELLELLRSLGPAKRTGTLRVEGPDGQEGRLWIEAGELVGGELGTATGMWAADLVGWLPEGEFELRPELPRELRRSMKVPLQTLLQRLADPEPPPAPELLRAGPPQEVRQLDRVEREKWARLMLVVPERREVEGKARFELVLRGPYVVPLAVRRAGQDAWAWFTHPASVFPPEAALWNVHGRGCLGARLVERTARGLRLRDELGAGSAGAELVSESFPGALGALRSRAFAAPEPPPWTLGLLDLELDLLDALRLSTLLLRSNAPRVLAKELLGLLERRTVRTFVEGCHDPEDLASMRALAEGQGDAEAHGASLRVRPEDFTRIADVCDKHGKQPILELLVEYEGFQREHGARLQELDQGIAGADARLEEIKQRVHRLQSDAAGAGKVTRLFKRTEESLRQLKTEAIECLRTKRSLEEAHREVPGWSRLQRLTDRVQSFQRSLDRVQELATDLFDHGVTQAHVTALREARDKLAAEPGTGLKQYDLRLRADVLPRLVELYACTAWILRRPDALPFGKPTWRKVAGINRLTGSLIDLYRDVRYGDRSLGEVFDASWGRVLDIEEQLAEAPAS